MLRINLLPPYIYEGAKRRNVTILWAVILLALIGGFVFAKMSLDAKAEQINQEMLASQQRANDADQAKTDADRITSESQMVRDRADFVRAVREYNTSTYQPVLANIAEWTPRNVLYDGVTLSGQTATLPAYAPSLAAVGHYILNMQRNQQISNVHVAIGTIPGFPVPQGTGMYAGQGATGARPYTGRGHNFTATLTLVTPIPGAPAFPSAGGQGGGGGMQGGGMPMGPGPGAMMPGPGGMMPGPGGPGGAPMPAPGGPGGPSTGGGASGGPRAGGRAGAGME